MADCRNLIEFPRAFEHHRRRASSLSSDSASPRPRCAPLSSSRSRGGLFTSLCEHSPLAAVDALALLASLTALAFLAAPYERLLAAEAREAVAALHPVASCVPLAAGVAAGAAVLAWDAAAHRARRCSRPRCRGLRKAVELDIQLETEECVRRLRRSRCRGRAADGARGRAPRDRGGSQEDGATQRPHRAHLPRTMRVPQGQDGGVGR